MALDNVRRVYMTRSVTARNSQVAKKFYNLPLEVYYLIFSYLGYLDLCPLRFTCRKFYQVCADPLNKINLHTICTDLSRRHVRQLMTLTEKQASAIRELSICSSSGGPLGLGYRVLPSCPLKSQASEDLRKVVKKLTQCRILRISAVDIKHIDYQLAWMGAIDMTYSVLYAFCETKSSLKSLTLDFRTDNLPSLLHGGLESLPSYAVSDRFYGSLRVTDISLKVNANIAISRGLYKILLLPLYTPYPYGVNEVSLDLGEAYAEDVVYDVLEGKYFRIGHLAVIKLHNVTGMGHRLLEPKLNRYCYSLRVLTMENIIFRYTWWRRFLRDLKRKYFRLEELNLSWDVHTGSMSTSLVTLWNRNTIMGHSQTKVTYTGPEEHGALTALEEIACEDPLSVLL
ncbi:uncharacterized protein BO88DRAFT_402060 [Aspergillus vadensis CBS 113365]|uniref:F-box domain-containing protein n=1 Tax=Aspergillus vadensis (strain CBS 113365 / IMI 142717 / IBT 24658) TaxID=1448311 RepID=A0A319CY49_ASPVC|nr:hypothetical protein BO88DRAFT_402060 [Aspergillus vadensis CBS 113365]PYH73002.1 hypothetical protein BO88DRAFT_402060 [Aspergillus vadensis CBS 113365]